MAYELGRSYIKALYVKKKPYGPCGGSPPVYVPDLMELWSPDLPKVVPTSLNDSCYSNAKDCKPKVSKRIDTQNYITPLPPKDPFKGGSYTFKGEMMLETRNKDALVVRFNTDDVDGLDNSW